MAFGSLAQLRQQRQALETNRLLASKATKENVPQANINEFGREDFDAALINWDKVYTDAKAGVPKAEDLMNRFAPGGAGETAALTRSDQQFKDIVAAGTASQVQSGMSQKAGFLGLAASRERGIREDEIRGQTARDAIGATSLYSQMLTNLANVGLSRPTPAPFVQRIVTSGKEPQVGSASGGRTGRTR